MRKQLKQSKLLITALLVVMILSQGIAVFAEAPYKTFTVDGDGYYVETQTAYSPVKSITKVGDLSFTGAKDMVISKKGEIYIADAGNKRILVSDTEGNLIKIIGEGIVENPQGIYLRADDKLYVADEGKKQILVFDKKGELVESYGKPSHPLYGEKNNFIPQKVIADARGNMYVVCKGNSNGIVQISPAEGGVFLGYFGVNNARIDLMGMLRNMIFTDEQKSQLKRNEPATANNLTIDEKGLVYTITQGEKAETVKKLNMSGKDLLGGTAYDEYPSDIVTGSLDNIFVVSKDGYIYEYTSEGDLLFAFGGRDNGGQRVGLTKSASSIAIDEAGNLYILDEEKNEIQVFEPTEFTNIVHEALALYEKGKYVESKAPWQEVIEMNSLFDFAYSGVAAGLYKEENYEGALAMYRQGKKQSGYSDAFWEVRNVWLRENLVVIAILALMCFILMKVIKYWDKQKQILNPLRSMRDQVGSYKLVKELNFLWYFIKKPVDGYYGIKRERKVSILSSTLLIGIFFVIYVCNKYGTGFLFRMTKEGQFDIVTDAIYVFGIMGLVIVCNYLVATITDGEGRFRDVYSGFIYSCMPVFLILPITIILSNILTYNEAFIITFSQFICFSWTGILMIIMIKEIHNFTLGEVFKNIFFTIFTLLIVVLVTFILYILVSQVVDFGASIIGEVVYKLEN